MYPVSLFIPCIVDQWLPEIGMAAAALLEHAGCRPFFRTRQTCCGQVVYNAGDMDSAQKMARRFIEIFENDRAVVCPSGSCVQMVRNHYPLLFDREPAWQKRAKDLAGRVFEFSEFLVDRMGSTDMGARFAGKVAYHESCSLLYGLGVSTQPRQILEAVAGLELVPMAGADICCGFGGRFSVDYPEISTAMAQDKARWFIESGADVLVTGDPGCLLHLSGYMRRHHPEKQVAHIASFLTDHINQDLP